MAQYIVMGCVSTELIPTVEKLNNMKRKLGILILLALIAAILLEAATKQESMDAEGYVALANQMGAKGNHIEATEAFKNALKINLNYDSGLLGTGHGVRQYGVP